jgi:hypothetical protein
MGIASEFDGINPSNQTTHRKRKGGPVNKDWQGRIRMPPAAGYEANNHSGGFTATQGLHANECP